MAIQPLVSGTNIATRVFKTNQPVLGAIPRLRFSYYAEFFLSTAAQNMVNADLNGWQGVRSISFKVKSIDKPKMTLSTKELNHYNKKKLIYTGVEYSEVSMKLHNSVDDSVLGMWVDYFTYFFADSRRTGTSSNPVTDDAGYSQSPVDATFNDGAGWGFRPLSDQTNFFTSVSVWALYNQTYTRISYVNPRITSIDWQNNDYSNSDPEEVSINFKYEAILYETFGQPLDQTTADKLGFDTLSQVPAAGILPRQQPRLFNGQQSGYVSSTYIGTVPPVMNQQSTASPASYATSDQYNINYGFAKQSGSSSLSAYGKQAMYSVDDVDSAANQVPQSSSYPTSQAVNQNFSDRGTVKSYIQQAVMQQISTQTGFSNVANQSGGYQLTDQMSGLQLPGSTYSQNYLSLPPLITDPVLTAASLAIAVGIYGAQTIPYALIQTVASVAAYVSAVANIPVASLFVEDLISIELIQAYNALRPKSSQVGYFGVNVTPAYANNPTLMGSVYEATRYDNR